MAKAGLWAVCVLAGIFAVHQVWGRDLSEIPLGLSNCIKQYQQLVAREQYGLNLDRNNLPPELDGDELPSPETCEDLVRALQSGRRRFKRKTHRNGKHNLPIGYQFESTMTEAQKESIRLAMSHIEAQTCVRFRELQFTGGEEHYLKFVLRSSCVSYVGKAKVAGQNYQEVFFTDSCLLRFGEVAHVIGQATGLWHEHQRSDRDEYVTINEANVQAGERPKFLTIPDSVLNTNGLKYDYASLFHAPSFAFARDGLGPTDYTVVTKEDIYQMAIGQRTGLTFLDAKHLNLMYSCSELCNGVSPRPSCLHGGYQDPNNCNVCRCPEGYSGTNCQDLEPPQNAICGGQYNALPTAMDITSPGWNNPSGSHYNSFISCTWYIKAPAGQKLQASFQGQFGIFAYEGTTCYHWVEIRLVDMDGLGQRYCGGVRPTDTFTAEQGEMMVLFRSNYSTDVRPQDRIGFRLSFRSVDENPCNAIRCENGGTCNRDTGVCNCRPGYRGSLCNEDVCKDNGSCENGATCEVDTSQRAGYKCHCMPGYTGLTCSTDRCASYLSTCKNGGTCQRTTSGYSCSCPRGYSGYNCELAVTEACPPGRCANGGICRGTATGSWSCICPYGYTGTTCNERDLCISRPCQNHGTCKVYEGGYICICPPGYQGQKCESRTTNACSRNPCQNGGICLLYGASGYQCMCSEGYYGENCGFHHPSPSKCGGYGLEPGRSEAVCYKNTPSCAGPGKYHNLACMECAPNAQKLVSYNFQTKQMSVTCGDIDECADQPCQNGATCQDGVNNYTCLCAPNFQGINCQDRIVSACEPNPCDNGGECEELDGGDFSCTCPDGFTGERCQEVQTCTCGGKPGTLVEPCATTKTKTVTRVVADEETCWYCWGWRRRKNTRLVTETIQYKEYSCCGGAEKMTFYDGPKCATPGWSEWSSCSASCGGCGLRRRYNYQLVRTRRRRRYQTMWSACGVEFQACNTKPCRGCLLFDCEPCCSWNGFEYDADRDQCIQC